MRILALETSDKTGGVAALDGRNTLAELALGPDQRSAQSLAPVMQTLLRQVRWEPKDVQLVAVAAGPGSFTGLRVGVTAAKVFAYAVGAEVLGVDTLEAIALNRALKAGCQICGTGCQPVTEIPTDSQVHGTGCQPVLHVAMDAQRGDVVARAFEIHSPDRVEPLGPQELIPADEWRRRLTPGSFVSGPALVRHAKNLPPNVAVLDRELWFPRASSVGLLAERQYAAGRRDDVWNLVPRYCRRSAAEEKWDAMGK